MRNRRRLLLFASLPIAIVAILSILAMLPPHRGVTRANFDRIEMGMTNAQVEAIFEKPGDVERRMGGVRWFVTTRTWTTDDGAIASVTFAESIIQGARGTGVTSKTWIDSTESIVQKIRRWFRLP